MWFEIGNRTYKLSRSIHHNSDDITVGHESWVLLMRQCHIMILSLLKLCNEKILAIT